MGGCDSSEHSSDGKMVKEAKMVKEDRDERFKSSGLYFQACCLPLFTERLAITQSSIAGDQLNLQSKQASAAQAHLSIADAQQSGIFFLTIFFMCGTGHCDWDVTRTRGT